MSNRPDITEALQGLGDWLWPAAAELPPAVEARARRLWLDTVSCAWAGLRAQEPAAWVRAQLPGDAGSVPLPGSGVRLSASAAATSFALAACWDEACEGLALAHGRPGVPIVAALWSQLGDCQPSWNAVFRATAAGYEVAARLGARLRIRPGMHVDGVWGALGAAVAVVHLQGGSWADAVRAMEACAAQLPFTLYQPVRQGANLRNLYLGHSAWLGVQGARAVNAGLTMASGCLDEFGAIALDPDEAGAVPPPGEWLILQSYWKPFAAVRHVHYGAQAALHLRAGFQGIRLPDELRLTVYPEALHYCPNRAPQSVLAAQFSLSFGLAAAWLFGDLSPAEFRAPRFLDADLRALESRIELRADAAAFPAGQRGARLWARLGGVTAEWLQGPVTGDVGHEPDEAAVSAKYRQFTGADTAMTCWAGELLAVGAQGRANWPSQGD